MTQQSKSSTDEADSDMQMKIYSSDPLLAILLLGVVKSKY